MTLVHWQKGCFAKHRTMTKTIKKGRSRPHTAYELFAKQERPKIRAEHPEWGLGEISKSLSQHWKKVTDEERKTFVEQAKLGRQTAANETGDNQSANVEPSKTAYKSYCDIERRNLAQQNPYWPKPRITAELRARWLDMSAKDKKQYIPKERTNDETDKESGIINVTTC